MQADAEWRLSGGRSDGVEVKRCVKGMNCRAAAVVPGGSFCSAMDHLAVFPSQAFSSFGWRKKETIMNHPNPGLCPAEDPSVSLTRTLIPSTFGP